MAKMGRPPKEIDERVFRSLCKIQCTQSEICSVLDVTDKTLSRWCKRTFGLTFSEAYQKYSLDGKMSLRRAMYDKAVTQGNTSMQIWLSKQYLGMSEKMQVDQSEVLGRLDSVLKGIKDDVDAQAKLQEE